MENFYIITPIEADLIGQFSVNGHGVDPYCGLQNNGNYIIKVEDVNTYSDRPEILSVNFASKTVKTPTELDFYIPPDPE